MKPRIPRPVGRFDLNVIVGAVLIGMCLPGIALGILWLIEPLLP